MYLSFWNQNFRLEVQMLYDKGLLKKANYPTTYSSPLASCSPLKILICLTNACVNASFSVTCRLQHIHELKAWMENSLWRGLHFLNVFQMFFTCPLNTYDIFKLKKVWKSYIVWRWLNESITNTYELVDTRLILLFFLLLLREVKETAVPKISIIFCNFWE